MGGIVVIYFVCYSIIFILFIRCTKNNASIILRSEFCCCVFVKPADIVRSCKRQNRPFNDFIGRFSQATEPRPQKLANSIDRPISALQVFCEFPDPPKKSDIQIPHDFSPDCPDSEGMPLDVVSRRRRRSRRPSWRRGRWCRTRR